MNVAYNIDCMEYMKTLPDKAFDLQEVLSNIEAKKKNHGYL